MSPPSTFAQKLWQDHGSVVSVELVCVAAVAMLGMGVGLTSVRDAAISEIVDIAGSVQDLNQSYTFDQASGHSSATNGSAFIDATDHCDQPEDVAGAFENCIALLEPKDETSPPLISNRVEAEGSDVVASGGGSTTDAWILWSNGSISYTLDLPEEGTYQFSARLWGSHGGPDLPNAAFVVDGNLLQNFGVLPTSFATADTYQVDVTLSAGSHEFSVQFTNDFYVPPMDRNLFVDWLDVEGPND